MRKGLEGVWAAYHGLEPLFVFLLLSVLRKLDRPQDDIIMKCAFK